MPVHVRFENINGQLRAFLDKPLHVFGWVIPEGFDTDFASVPKIFWNILPPIGSYTEAAVLHDYLYRTGQVSRSEADAIFLNAMEQEGTGFITRYIMYYAVRIFAKRYFHECRCTT